MSAPVCLECGGRGYVCYLDDRNPNEWPTQKCPDCGGSGQDTDPVARAILAMGEAERELDQSAAKAHSSETGA